MSISGLKTFAETGASDVLDELSQGEGGIFDEFNAPPISQGVGRTEAEFFVDGNHSKVIFSTGFDAKLSPLLLFENVYFHDGRLVGSLKHAINVDYNLCGLVPCCLPVFSFVSCHGGSQVPSATCPLTLLLYCTRVPS